MNCHIVPRCYLKSWKIPAFNNSIYVFDKNKTTAINNNKNIDNLSDTNFALEDKYLINIFNKDYMHKFYPQFSSIMKELGITATYNHKKILNLSDYMDNLDSIERWTYIDSCGAFVDNSIVINAWKEKISIVIEKYFANNIEPQWTNVKNYTSSHIMKRSWKVSAEHKNTLIEFVSLQLLRRFENMQELGLSKLINVLNEMAETTIFDTSYEESHWLIQLYNYAINKNNNSISRSVKCINDIYQPCFLISTGTADFITSDNPCYIIKNSSYSSETGIYMPINPKVCLFLCNVTSYVDKNKYYIFDINDQNVKYINHKTRSHALKQVAYHSDNISNLLCKNIDKANWDVIPTTLYNELVLNK